jgi:hypothetical protein
LDERGEQGLVQKLIPQPAIEGFNEAILHGLSRRVGMKASGAGL